MIPSVKASADGPVWNYDIMNGYIYGTGYGPGVNATRHCRGDVKMLMFALSTPVDAEMTHTRMAFTWKKYPEGSEDMATATHLYHHSIGEADGEESKGFETVDLIIWDNKKFGQSRCSATATARSCCGANICGNSMSISTKAIRR